MKRRYALSDIDMTYKSQGQCIFLRNIFINTISFLRHIICFHLTKELGRYLKYFAVYNLCNYHCNHVRLPEEPASIHCNSPVVWSMTVFSYWACSNLKTIFNLDDLNLICFINLWLDSAKVKECLKRKFY